MADGDTVMSRYMKGRYILSDAVCRVVGPAVTQLQSTPQNLVSDREQTLTVTSFLLFKEI